MPDMNRLDGLPGFEAVLREHKRLAYKLTKDEFQAIKDYIKHRMEQEQADVNFRLSTLQSDYDITQRRSSETISGLSQELNDKKGIINYYQSTDKTISVVQKRKEERWAKKQDLMLTEIQKLEGEATRVKTQLKNVESELEAKTKDVEELEDRIDEANTVIEMVEEAKAVIKQRDDMKNEILKWKLEVDKRERQVQLHEKTIDTLKRDVDSTSKEKQYADLKVATMTTELKKQVAEVAAKCKDLSRLQFQLQMEKRQAETLQNQLRKATEDVQNYKRMLEGTRPALSSHDPVVISLRKDLDIMDIRIRSLDIAIRLRIDEAKKVEQRLDELNTEERLLGLIKADIHQHGNTFVELTVSELAKKYELSKQKLYNDMKCARDWTEPKKDADLLRAEVTALMKQTAICKVVDLSTRAGRQLQKIDLIMRVTGDNSTVKMPQIFNAPDKLTNGNVNNHVGFRQIKKPKPLPGDHKPAFITSSSGLSAFDNSLDAHRTLTRKRISVNTRRSYGHPPINNQTDETKYQYLDTVEMGMDLARLTPSNVSSRRSNQSDRISLRSVSSSTLRAASE